ncbi:hypothetical protein AQUCO_02800252v1 [Aquilegia coerulea]|uniref:Phosphatidic acid phosphatase type 2/haloperoxidase domain-containing protein n=1 Tax=Aquilegia coerulea TaxID=218851 RepID=A0A2G5D4G7_AQUCA|nr:hypothetical protein AQUCO_02800252v1 [Aquilegia coerulea]
MVTEVIRTPVFRNATPDDREGFGISDGSSSEFHSDMFSEGLDYIINKMSKWLFAALVAALVIWKHDGEALWVAMGFAMNSWLAIALKHILNHERPISTLRSDPGMPSSHSQLIFFGVIFIILSMAKYAGLNGNTLIAGVLTLSSGSYLSWLRISHKLHTIRQVLVGAVLGAIFSFLWFQAWYSFIFQAFTTSLWVRVAVFFGSASLCVSYVLFMFKNGLAEKP